MLGEPEPVPDLWIPMTTQPCSVKFMAYITYLSIHICSQGQQVLDNSQVSLNRCQMETRMSCKTQTKGKFE